MYHCLFFDFVGLCLSISKLQKITYIICLVLPDECHHYDGPHELDCLVALWLEGGCLEKGWKYPTNYSEQFNGTVNSNNLMLVTKTILIAGGLITLDNKLFLRCTLLNISLNKVHLKNNMIC